ncbi:MAG TPA: imidazole glycerol phosphate synthase subunit HisH [Microthrixaceae bacterium]|nr:imidazole glycerol phosphate synthase subunit HisH [Microthrixaceae bacterium]
MSRADEARIAVVDYGIGNLRSAEKALQHVGGRARLTADVAEIDAADAVVLPGVGAFGACMGALDRSGLRPVVEAALGSGRPFLGICVGMQMLCRSSTESPGVDGLGFFDTEVVRIPGDVKLPQMQWNQLEAHGGVSDTSPVRRAHPVIDGMGERPWVYFVHSYAAEECADTIAVCQYGGPVTAVLARESVIAVQFHPEKSGRSGLTFLADFVTWAGSLVNA